MDTSSDYMNNIYLLMHKPDFFQWMHKPDELLLLKILIETN
jgi:hypothetical protein